MDKRFERIAVLVPAFNASKTLGELLERVQNFVPSSNILVVDDGSADGTGELARHLGVRVLSHSSNLGKGRALKTGFDALKENKQFDSVFTLDADLQHHPEELASFIEKKRQTGGDVVVGKRNRVGTAMPIHRRLSNAITSFLVSVRTGTTVLDSQCGFRLIQRAVLMNVSIDSDGFEAETEFLIKAIKNGYTVEFVPIETIYGGEGSHMRKWTTIQSFIRVLLKDY